MEVATGEITQIIRICAVDRLRPILGKPVHDPTSGFVDVNRTALGVFSRSFPLEYLEIEALVVLQRKRFRFVEVPYRFRTAPAGRSTITAVKSSPTSLMFYWEYS